MSTVVTTFSQSHWFHFSHCLRGRWWNYKIKHSRQQRSMCGITKKELYSVAFNCYETSAFFHLIISLFSLYFFTRLISLVLNLVFLSIQNKWQRWKCWIGKYSFTVLFLVSVWIIFSRKLHLTKNNIYFVSFKVKIVITSQSVVWMKVINHMKNTNEPVLLLATLFLTAGLKASMT